MITMLDNISPNYNLVGKKLKRDYGAFMLLIVGLTAEHPGT